MITTPQDYEFSLQSSCNVITHPFCQIYVTWPRLKPQPCSFLRSISALSAVTFRGVSPVTNLGFPLVENNHSSKKIYTNSRHICTVPVAGSSTGPRVSYLV